MLHLFLIFYIWIKSQGLGLGHFQFMPKYQKGRYFGLNDSGYSPDIYKAFHTLYSAMKNLWIQGIPES